MAYDPECVDCGALLDETSTCNGCLSKIQDGWHVRCRELDKKIASLQTIVDVTVAWRAAEVHKAAVNLGIRKGSFSDAEDVLFRKELNLRKVIGAYHKAAEAARAEAEKQGKP